MSSRLWTHDDWLSTTMRVSDYCCRTSLPMKGTMCLKPVMGLTPVMN